MYARTLQPPTTVFASAATGLAEFIDRLGGDAQAVFGETGLALDPLAQPNAVVNLHRYSRALARAADCTGRHNFGLWFGQQYMPRQLGMFGYLSSSSPTLGDALRNMRDYFPFHQKNSRMGLEVRGPHSLVTYAVDDVLPEARHDSELSLGQLLNILREPLGRDWTPVQVLFAHHRPTQSFEHRNVFGTDVLFEQGCNGILLHTRDLETPMPYRDPLLMGVMKQSLRQFGEHPAPLDLSVGARAREEIRGLLRHGYPMLEEVAKRLGLPSWTFRRRLAEESANFKDLVEAVRIQESLVLLRRRHLSVSQVAELLGYSEISAFSRAFSRWYQLSPRQWRDAEAPAATGPTTSDQQA